jgi:Mg2+ and Co2+ transporter CorA
VEILEAASDLPTETSVEEECKTSDVLFFRYDEARKMKDHQHIIQVARLLRDDMKLFVPLVEGTQLDHEHADDQMRVSGSRFWMEEIEKYTIAISDLRDLYSNCLDEKRNFLTFALTITTILLTPMTILTGYW